jgi:thiamine-phosphate pyrophosphorylase
LNSPENKTGCRLYLITPQVFDPEAFCRPLAEALDAGDIAAVQLRLKNTTDTSIIKAAQTILPLCRKRNIPLLINDRPDLAQEIGCDGAHIGQKDTSYADARKTLDQNCIVGVTCHNSRHLAIEAAEKGADYVAFGAFFPTTTKIANFSANTDILKWWSDLMVVPCVAIGGITPENCNSLVRSGADFLAVVSAIWDHPDGPGPAVCAFNEAIRVAS